MAALQSYSESNYEAIGLLMTYRCNINCNYCYIQNKRNKDMTLDMTKGILLPYLQKRIKLDITFMGGETLLAIDVIRPLVEWVVNGSWEADYRFFGSTNGTLLTDELKEWLKEHCNIITLGLSYDGLPYVQQANRTSQFIDVDFFVETWPKQPIQMTIDDASVSKMADGIIFLLEKGATVHPNVAFEEKEWSEKSIKEYGSQLYELICYYQEHSNRPLITQFNHNLNEYAYCIDHHKTQLEVCGAGNGFHVYDIDGECYPCHILSPLVLTGEKLIVIKDGLVDKTRDFSDNRCVDCPYTSSCPTCIACNYLYRGSIQRRDLTHCRIMQMEVKATIKREVLRLKQKKTLTPKDATLIDSITKLVEYEKKHKFK